MRPAIRFVLAPLVFLPLATITARAQDFVTDRPVFAFATEPNGPQEVDDANDAPKGVKATADLTIRPNQSGEFYLYAYNPLKGTKTFIVDLRGGQVTAQAKVNIPEGKWVRVRLPKPPPPPAPAVPPAPPAPPAPGAAPAPPPEPPPPGAELPRDNFTFTLRLLHEDGTAVRDQDGKGKPYGRPVTVTVQRPATYIARPEGTRTTQDKLTTVEVTVKPQGNLTGTAVTTLSFPPELASVGATQRAGQYKRTLTAAEPVAKLTGGVENAPPGMKVYVGVDGIERAFVYKLPGAGEAGKANLQEVPDAAVRVYPAAGFKVQDASQPVPAYPVRVEAENDPVGATLEVWVRPVNATDPAANEVIRLGRVRDEQMWVDPSGPTDGGVLVSSRSRDWVKSLDLQPLRGPHVVIAVMKQGGKEIAKSEQPLLLTVDATGPVFIEFGKFPAKHVKGKPLPVLARATDPETDVAKAVFFLGKPTDDGKIPPDAVKVDGVRSLTDPTAWTAELPLPPEKRGELTVGVVFFNRVGLSTLQVQKVELVDAPPPSGTIVGRVKVGEIPQSGAVVVLKNAEGKEIATAKSAEEPPPAPPGAKPDPKPKPKVGEFKFENVPPGVYTVSAAKPSSSYPFAGSTPVTVKVGETSTVIVSMIKQVK